MKAIVDRKLALITKPCNFCERLQNLSAREYLNRKNEVGGEGGLVIVPMFQKFSHHINHSSRWIFFFLNNVL